VSVGTVQGGIAEIMGSRNIRTDCKRGQKGHEAGDEGGLTDKGDTRARGAREESSKRRSNENLGRL